MQLALRLYYPVDADLIAIRLFTKRNFTNLVRGKLTRLLDPSKNEMTDRDLYHVQDDIGKYVRNVPEPVKVNLNLKDGRDDILISYLKQIPVSVRSDVVKSLFRMCCDIYPHEYFPYEIFLSNPKTKILQTGTPIIKKKSANLPKAFSQVGKPTSKTDVKHIDNNSSAAELGKEDIKADIHPGQKQSEKEQKIETEIRHINSNETKTEMAISKSIQEEPDSVSDQEPENLKSTADSADDNEAYEMFAQMLGY